jgi:hypothetical protein
VNVWRHDLLLGLLSGGTERKCQVSDVRFQVSGFRADTEFPYPDTGNPTPETLFPFQTLNGLSLPNPFIKSG